MSRLRLTLALVVFACLAATTPVDSCPFCSAELGPTMVGEFANAQLVLFGTFSNPRLSSGTFEEGSTDFHIEQTLKSNEVIQGKSKITLPKYVDRPKSKFLLFCDVYKGRIDPYRAVEVTNDSDLLKYLSGAIGLKEKTPSDRLRYCFDFLTSGEMEVSLDAYREFAKADYKDYMEMAKKLDPEVIAGWLRDPKTPPYRYGLYASLLGHCGKEKHADLLKSLAADPEKSKGSGVDGILAGVVMIQPKEGWEYINTLLTDPKRDFTTRYACLRTIRFLWDQRTDLVEKREISKAMLSAVQQVDISDFAIDDLRKWKQWDVTPDVLKTFGTKSHDVGVIHRAILRFALQSPMPEAAVFVKMQRARDAEWVRDTEEILKLETGS